MNKSDLIRAVSRKTRIRGEVVDEVIDAALDLMAMSVSLEEPVNLRGFGKFEPRVRPPARLKHPQTGAPLPVEERRTVVFLPSPNLKGRMNGVPR